MNDTYINPIHEDDASDWLVTMLRDTRPASLADNGFTLRVMDKIPQTATRLRSGEVPRLAPRNDWRFYRSTLIGAAVGCIIAIAGVSLAGWNEIGQTILAAISLNLPPTAAWFPLLAGIGNTALLAYLLLDIERT